MAFVHGATAAEADPWFERAGLADVARVSDPDRAHYRAFGLETLGVSALVSPRVWARGALSALRHGFGRQPAAMLRQQPGVFVVQGPHLLAVYRHRSQSDRPDYLALIREAQGVTIR